MAGLGLEPGRGPDFRGRIAPSSGRPAWPKPVALGRKARCGLGPQVGERRGRLGECVRRGKRQAHDAPRQDLDVLYVLLLRNDLGLTALSSSCSESDLRRIHRSCFTTTHVPFREAKRCVAHCPSWGFYFITSNWPARLASELPPTQTSNTVSS